MLRLMTELNMRLMGRCCTWGRVLLLAIKWSLIPCPLAYCRFGKQDKYPDIIPDYERIKEKYKDKINYPSIDPGKVLLVLSNFDEYYFHSLYYVPGHSEDGECLEYTGWPHIGTFQDSYLIHTEDYKIDFDTFRIIRTLSFTQNILMDAVVYRKYWR